MATIKSIKEKAKAYDEAKARMSKAWNDNRCTLSFMNEIFPELKEESKDERIKNELLSFLKEGKPYHCPNSIKRQEWAAWVEKQGNNMGISEAIKKKLEDNLNKALEKETPESWNKFLDEQGEQKPNETIKWSPQEESCICQLESLVKEQWRQAERVHNSVNIKKMTELMFFLKTLNPNKKSADKANSVMNILNNENREVQQEDLIKKPSLITIENEPKNYKQQIWSEKDIRLLNNCISLIEDIDCTKKEQNFLKSLKYRMQPQPKQEWKQENTGDLTDFENAMMHIGNSFFGENAGLDPNDTNSIKKQANILLGLVSSKEWSEEDEETLNTIINHFKIDIECTDEDDVVRWLKSLKERVQPQPKQEWSKEDIATISRVISIVKWAAYSDHSHPILNDEGATELVERLKSLKERYTWKPSDEQLKLLKKVIDAGYYTSYPYALETLYEQLRQF